MKDKNKSKISQLLFILFNFFLLVQSHKDESPLDDETSMKALSCLNVVSQNVKVNNAPQPTIYSPEMLACFMKISDDQAESIFANLQSGVMPLDDEEVAELTNVESLKKFPSEEINQKSKELEKAIEEFKKFDEDFTHLKERKLNENSDDDEDDDDNVNQENIKKENKYWKAIRDWLDDNNNYFIGIPIVIVVFVFILLFGKSYDESLIKVQKAE